MTFLQKAYFHLPHAGFNGTKTSHILFLEKGKTEEDNKNIRHLAFTSVADNCPTTNIQGKK